jgi:hypothetical protein
MDDFEGEEGLPNFQSRLQKLGIPKSAVFNEKQPRIGAYFSHSLKTS